MKLKISAAVLFAAISLCLISCNWLFGKKEAANKMPLITGTWKIDSIYSLTHGTPQTGQALQLFSSLKDSMLKVQFKPDSTFKILDDSASQWEKYYVKDSSLYLHEDSGFTLYKLNFVKDSMLTLLAKDSIAIELTRE